MRAPVLARIAGLFTFVVSSALATGTAHGAGNKAPAFLWKSRVWLNNDFDAVSASNANYTISAKFFPQYALPHYGVIFTANGSNGHKLVIAQQIDYHKTNCYDPVHEIGCTGEVWEPAISLWVDRTETIQRVSTTLPGLKMGQWNHVAVVFKNGLGWKVLLNGINVIDVADGGFRPYGKMTIGNASTYNKFTQFYGLIDDVAVFTTALSGSVLTTLQNTNRLTAMSGMKYGWTFDATPTLTAESNVPTLGSNAVWVGVSDDRHPLDIGAVPKPIQSATFRLPIPVEYEAFVVKGNSSDHHSGPWAWTWDFLYAGKRSDSTTTRQNTDPWAVNLASGKGRKLVAAADGEVVQANWNFVEGDGSTIPNSVQIRHAPGEYSSYYHFTKNSFKDLFPWSGSAIRLAPADFATVDSSPLGSSPTIYPLVSNAEAIGAEGGTGMLKSDGTPCFDCFHLHYGVLDQPDIAADYGDRITKPTEFVDYEYSYDRLTWYAGAGVPQVGTYVRRMPEPVTASPQSGACGRLDANEGMYPNKPIYSCDGRFRLYLQSDSNLVLGKSDSSGNFTIAVWATYGLTIGKDGYTALMEVDGNFAYYDSKGKRIWHTNTAGNFGGYLRMHDNGNMAVYSKSGTKLWETDTGNY